MTSIQAADPPISVNFREVGDYKFEIVALCIGSSLTDDWHQVKLVRDTKSGTIEIFFDDMEKPVMTANDKRFGLGQIGIGSFDDMNDFDEIRLYAPKK